MTRSYSSLDAYYAARPYLVVNVDTKDYVTTDAFPSRKAAVEASLSSQVVMTRKQFATFKAKNPHLLY